MSDQQLIKINKETENLKSIMKLNIEKAIERGEKIELINDKAIKLEQDSNIFDIKATGLKRKECRKLWATRLIFLFILLFIIGIIIAVIYASKR